MPFAVVDGVDPKERCIRWGRDHPAVSSKFGGNGTAQCNVEGKCGTSTKYSVDCICGFVGKARPFPAYCTALKSSV